MINKEITSFIKESNDIEGYVYPIEDYEKYFEYGILEYHNAYIEGQRKVFDYLEQINNLYVCFISKSNDLLVNNLLHCHRLLMYGLPNSENIKIGQYRDCNVRVGGRLCPDYKEVTELMEKFIIDYNSMEHDHLEMHYIFELIHPFQDGNGRIGRLLYLYDLLRRCLPVKNILDNFKGETFEEKRANYYRAIDNFNNKKGIL